MQVLRTANPLTGRGLRAGQRLAYAFTLLGWFDAWRALGYLLVPVAVLLSGAVPIRAGLSTFVLLFGATFVAQQLALWLLGRGYHRPWLSVVFDLARMPANLAATLTLLAGGRNRGFDVTPKGRSGTGQRRVRVPWLLWALLALHAAAAGWCLATVAHRTPLHYGVPAAAYAAFVWLLVNAGYLGAAILRIRALRYGGERRASVRFAVTLHGSLDGVDCQVEDLSLSGARCRFSAPPPGDPQTLTVDAPGHPVTLTCVARTRTQRKDDAQVVSVEFLPGQWAEQATLTTLLFNAGIGLEATRAEPVPLPTGRS
jgi:cellulose synthase (UDP-forming)